MSLTKDNLSTPLGYNINQPVGLNEPFQSFFDTTSGGVILST